MQTWNRPPIAALLLASCLTSPAEYRELLEAATDADGDGYHPAAGDCDDTNPDIHPGAAEVWYDGVDSDCDGNDLDADADGHDAAAYGGDDCDDNDPLAAPGLQEECDGVDEDCDGLVDEGMAVTWYDDADGDGYGDPTLPAVTCLAPSGFVDNDDDCDDERPDVFPGAEEVCGDGVVNDCDGTAANCQLTGNHQVFGELGGGAEINAQRTGDGFGAALNLGGDVDGDGRADLIIGAIGESSVANDQGAAYLITTAATGSLDMPGDATAVLRGEQAIDWAGKSVAIVPDVTGDGHAELVVAATGVGLGNGMVYFLPGPVEGTIDLGTVSTYIASSSIFVDPVILAPGDINGDGLADLVLGDARQDSYAGVVHVLPSSVTGAMSTSSAHASVAGEASYDFAGSAVAAGDLDGDGLAELLVGAPDGAGGKGRAYVLRSPINGSFGLEDADTFLTGEADGDRAGQTVAVGGDVDGDGTADFIVGAPEADSGRGRAYVFSGFFQDSLDLDEARAVLEGSEQGAHLGIGATLGTDFDGDGDADVVVSANLEDRNGPGSGAVFVFYDAVNGTLTSEDAPLGFHGMGSGDGLGSSVAGGGDLNGDGLQDLVVGALGADAVYVLRGRGF